MYTERPRTVQFSLFGAALAMPSLDDLAGVILAGGDWVRTEAGEPGRARLSVVVEAPWRVEAIAAAFTELGLGSSVAAAENGTGVRTDFSARLVDEAARWTRGAAVHAPAGLALTPRGLRLWAIAAGRPEPSGYLLGTADPEHELHRYGGSQLAALGLAATSITVRTEPGWRISSVKRLRRLAELLADAPPGAGRDWPA